MESIPDPDRPDTPKGEGEEYSAGTETPSDPPGVGDGDLDESQPGLAGDPPQAD